MNIHLPAILMFTRGTRFWHTAISSDFPEASMISCSLHELISGGWFIVTHPYYSISYIYISSTKKALHIIQSTSIHYFQSSSTIPWYPSYKMLGLKDPAFENRPSRPHSGLWWQEADDSQDVKRPKKRHTASWGKAGRNGGDLWSWPEDQPYFPQNMGWF